MKQRTETIEKNQLIQKWFYEIDQIYKSLAIWIKNKGEKQITSLGPESGNSLQDSYILKE